MRLATWNVNSVKARLPRLLEWLAATGPDIVRLQETKVAAALFPAAEVGELGYQTAAHGTDGGTAWRCCRGPAFDDVSLGFPGEPGYAGEPAGLTLSTSQARGGPRPGPSARPAAG